MTKLVTEKGADARFPFDAIWEYADEPVPSPNRPVQARRLQEEGYLQLTGGFTRAASAARAGSPTREYRPGPRFQSKPRTTGKKQLLGVSESVSQLASSMGAAGFIVTAAELANFYLAMQVSPIVILTGISGSGKSKLPRMFAELVGARLKAVPVKPNWDDNSDLFGYTSALRPSQFVAGPFTTAISAAHEDAGAFWLFLLDEMNLAAVEHYFSDFLSVIETRRRHEGQIVTDRLPLDLPVPPVNELDPYAELRDLGLPPNVRVVGTANMDETTRGFSPKVLDRAFSIEFDEVDLAAFPILAPGRVVREYQAIAERLLDQTAPIAIGEALPQAQAFFEDIVGQLEEVREILRPAGITFAYRTRDAICLYMWHWQHDQMDAVLPMKAALDYCILQKILPKVYGQGERLRDALSNLLVWLQEDEHGYLRSVAKTERMLRRLDDDGATTYWGS